MYNNITSLIMLQYISLHCARNIGGCYDEATLSRCKKQKSGGYCGNEVVRRDCQRTCGLCGRWPYILLRFQIFIVLYNYMVRWLNRIIESYRLHFISGQLSQFKSATTTTNNAQKGNILIYCNCFWIAKYKNIFVLAANVLIISILI